jgi:hypothetical protein
MTATLDTAVEQMQQLFKAAWDAGTSAIAGYVPDVEWYGAEGAAPVNREKIWARFSSQNVFEQQATLSTAAGTPGAKRYSSSGLVFIQLFIPKTIDNGVILGRQLAQVAKNAFRGKTTSGKVEFHNVTIKDLTPEELFYRINVVADYDFDELG